MTDEVLYEVDGHVATLTLNRPDQRNAVSPELTSAMDAAMERFAGGQARLLVATTVIEVGVDVPNATLMVIEQAERFGLAQLHQLRGRVGRGEGKSVCLLLRGEALSETAKRRLALMRETQDGFRIAEEEPDLTGLDGWLRELVTDCLAKDPARRPTVASLLERTSGDVTYTGAWLPGEVLAQLGSRVQHQVRAHTPKDAKALRQTVATFPSSDYDLAQVLLVLMPCQSDVESPPRQRHGAGPADPRVGSGHDRSRHAVHSPTATWRETRPGSGRPAS